MLESLRSVNLAEILIGLGAGWLILVLFNSDWGNKLADRCARALGVVDQVQPIQVPLKNKKTKNQPTSTAIVWHILSDYERDSKEMKEELDRSHEVGTDFKWFAVEKSTCGTKTKAGEIGQVSPGKLAPEIDAVVFHPELELGKPYGPIKTHFGYHIIMVTKRQL
eukprot:m.78548 g.78548  ORF g.78548 m.78548 type:complete len:165 (-) comp25125_c0_seq1:146-640(-)